jgi:hypothetical protein
MKKNQVARLLAYVIGMVNQQLLLTIRAKLREAHAIYNATANVEQTVTPAGARPRNRRSASRQASRFRRSLWCVER